MGLLITATNERTNSFRQNPRPYVEGFNFFLFEKRTSLLTRSSAAPLQRPADVLLNQIWYTFCTSDLRSAWNNVGFRLKSRL